jgi:hypothetical protein
MYGAIINKLQKSPMRSNQPMRVILSETGCLRVAISNRATTMNIRSAPSAELKVNEDERFVRFPKVNDNGCVIADRDQDHRETKGSGRNSRTKST